MKKGFNLLFEVAKGAAKDVLSMNKEALVNAELYEDSKLRKVHEIFTLLMQIISSVISLIKLIRAMFPLKPIKFENPSEKSI